MKLIDGNILRKVQLLEVEDHLKSLKRETHSVHPGQLKIIAENNQALLLIKIQTKTLSYPIRRTFLYKLLKWYGINSYKIAHFKDDTLLAICNDNLNAISRKNNVVHINIESNEAISILSNNYTPIDDLEILDIIKKNNKIDFIDRDDFCMRVVTEIKSKAEPFVGDVCGFGINIVNSQTGFAPLNAEHYILRYSCTNGATSKIHIKDSKIVHYSRSKNEVLEAFGNILPNIPQTPERFIAMVKQSINIPASKQFPNIKFKVSNAIGDAQGYKFFDKFDQTQSNCYDLFNYITDSAKKYNVLERYSLESLAGNLIEFDMDKI